VHYHEIGLKGRNRARFENLLRRNITVAVGDLTGHPLHERLVNRVLEGFERRSEPSARFGHPNLGRTDVSEVLWALAVAGVPWDERLGGALRRLQKAQNQVGRWPLRLAVPSSLRARPGTVAAVGESSRWITLRAVVALNAYAVPAGLPRMFPEKPSEG
jgi:hypothetical protein